LASEGAEALLALVRQGGAGAGASDPDQVAEDQGDGLLDEARGVSLEQRSEFLDQLSVGASKNKEND